MQTFDTFVPQRRFLDVVALSPDGSTVACTSNDAGSYDLVVLPVAGGEPRRITRFPDRSVRAVAWSPDGTHLAFAADQDGDEQTQIFLVALDGSEPVRLTDRDDSQFELGARPFTPDGTRLVYTGNDRDPSTRDVLVHDLASGEVRRVEGRPGLATPVAVSPDGRWLSLQIPTSTTSSSAAVVDLEADEPHLRTLTTGADDAQHVPGPWLPDSGSFWLLTDRDAEFRKVATCTLDGDLDVVHAPDADVEAIAATPDGGRVVWVVNEPEGFVPFVLDRAPVGGPDRGGAPRRVDLPAGVLDAPALLPDGATLVGLWGSPVRPRELVAIDLGSGDVRYLTESRPPAILAGTAVAPRAITYATHDGLDVPAWLYRPDPAVHGDGPLPVVVSVHGGPEAQERAEYNYAGLYQFLLSRGIGVIAPNVRGSTGYGKSYQRLILRDWGGAELGDLEQTVRYLHGLDWVDPERIAVFGGSFGGFAALSCLSRLPELFAAGVSVVGPSNLVTLGSSVPETWRPFIKQWVGDPVEDREMLLARSPITYADRIVAPLYVVQGAKDPRVVQAESDQIVEALRARGVEVRYDVFEDEGHGFTKRENEITALGDISGFLVEQLSTTGRAVRGPVPAAAGPIG